MARFDLRPSKPILDEGIIVYLNKREAVKQKKRAPEHIHGWIGIAIVNGEKVKCQRNLKRQVWEVIEGKSKSVPTMSVQ